MTPVTARRPSFDWSDVSGPLSYDEALSARDQIWSLQFGNNPPPLLDDRGRCWKKITKRAEKNVWVNGLVSRWPPTRAYFVDVGIFPIRDDVPMTDGRRFRLSVRVQTPVEMRKTAFREIESYYKEQTAHLASVRNVGPVRLLSKGFKNIDGGWRGPHSGVIGGPISRAFGQTGAIGFFGRKPASDGAELFLITAGHVAAGLNEPPSLEERVYCPPAGNGPGHPDHCIAQLHDWRLPTVEAIDVIEDRMDALHHNPQLDVGIARITPNAMATVNRTGNFVVDVGAISSVRDFDKSVPNDPVRVIKVPAKSKKRKGWATAFNAIVTCMMPDYRVVVLSGAIEVAGDKNPFAVPGDSGALVVDGDGRGCGIVVAGTANGEILTDSKGATYIMPMSAILQEFNLELV